MCIFHGEDADCDCDKETDWSEVYGVEGLDYDPWPYYGPEPEPTIYLEDDVVPY